MTASLWGAAAFGLSFATCGLLMRLLLPILVRRAILDQPNERSSHWTPTPRGGGLAVVLVALVGLIAATLSVGGDIGRSAAIVVAAAVLAAVSWVDDVRGLPALPRLLAQVLAVSAGLWSLPGEALVFQGWLPPLADRVVAGIGWIWFINLFNFMDGIDGISGVECLALGAGVFLAAKVLPLDAQMTACVLAGAGAGFLIFNWHPARVFLGDVGSVPAGFLFGWLLLWMAGAGQWAAALILPAYYLADATFTLMRRLLRGEPPWRAHREHFYQQACATLGHAGIVLRIAAGNLILLALALISTAGGSATWLALAAAAVVVGMLLTHLHRAGRR